MEYPNLEFMNQIAAGCKDCNAITALVLIENAIQSSTIK